MSGWVAVCVTCGLTAADVADDAGTVEAALAFQLDHRCQPEVRITEPGDADE